MARTTRKGRGGERRISVRGVRREPVDVRKLSRALIALAQAQAEAEAEAQSKGQHTSSEKGGAA